MEILLDYLTNWGLKSDNPWDVFAFIFTHGGFILVFWVLVTGFMLVWLEWRSGKFSSQLKWVYLAIDVPRNNEQSPKAVEQIFNQLWGIIKGPTFVEKWLDGYGQVNYSLELVSIDGYVQFVIRCLSGVRDVVEAAIYAQYPEAQITEIEDYAKNFTPDNFKELGYDLWGAQIGIIKDEMYPIRTYPIFEHAISKTKESIGIIDPLAALLEIFSRFNRGEQGWLQITIRPVDDSWKEKCLKEVQKIIGAPTKPPAPGLVDQLLDMPVSAVSKFADQMFIAASVKSDEKKQDVPSKMLYLSPGERQTVEAIDNKATKTGFKAKIRYIYLYKKEIGNKSKGVSGVMGALKQFSALNSNGFKPLGPTVTNSNLIFKSLREKKKLELQRKILKSYKSRSSGSGISDKGYFILNTEELATLYHFPYKGVAGTSVKAVSAKRAEAPYTLPYAEETEETKTNTAPAVNKTNNLSESDKLPAPDNLPM